MPTLTVRILKARRDGNWVGQVGVDVTATNSDTGSASQKTTDRRGYCVYELAADPSDGTKYLTLHRGNEAERIEVDCPLNGNRALATLFVGRTE